MVYDFSQGTDRLKTHAVKWQEVAKDSAYIPLGIADMDFPIAPEIQEALLDYVKTGDYGYAYTSQNLYQAVIDWEAEQFSNPVLEDEILFVSGVVPSISIALQALTQPGDSILINTPYYGPIPRTIQLLDRQLVKNELIKVDGRYQIDFALLEQQIKEQDVRAYVLCNPQNPSGRVWTREELERIGNLCLKHDVLLIIDEIHRDLTLYGNQHTSFNTIDPRFRDISIVLSSATKTFNLAATKNSMAIIANPKLRKAFIRQRLANNQHEVPTLGMVATEAAFTKGKPWLLALRKQIEQHADYVAERLGLTTKIQVMKPEATYLLWLDFSAYGLEDKDLYAKWHDQAKLLFNEGTAFGQAGSQHARMNLALPFERIAEACDRLIEVFGTGQQ
ncbi:cystathionine beta-lyase [Streptococcus rupicaprae]|uniref:cysteine-S-conjugate beta-lyase n=1 Tax=Streptococcus rupicaprae TaxID=759619 RepID=A0ABV2FG64_9STRE